ncbi:hypothetical protein CEXT_273511 [Caerostris extrusa]|uniref:Uncharacterized protein n=1 Tax=Caerostris extrusa TaxID=172846 RepID=A0AAV4WGI1_CAEEX|nr:hypothetical protein CEXT_273511 [Caerostris extrusa]
MLSSCFNPSKRTGTKMAATLILKSVGHGFFRLRGKQCMYRNSAQELMLQLQYLYMGKRVYSFFSFLRSLAWLRPKYFGLFLSIQSAVALFRVYCLPTLAFASNGSGPI